MKGKLTTRALSLMLVLAMVVTMLPVGVLAEEAAVYTRITSADELTTGKYVMTVSTGYAPTVWENGWVLAEEVSVTGDTVTDPAGNLLWEITVAEDGTVHLADSNGTYIGPKGGNVNGVIAHAYGWTVTCTDGLFRFLGQGEDTVTLASNVGHENLFRGYKNNTVNGSYADSYPCDFTLYKLGAEQGPVEEDTVTDAGDVREVLDAAEGKFRVKGVVNLLDGKNVYIQDFTGGICVRLSDVTGIEVGDVLYVSGTRGEYNGIPQLNNAEVISNEEEGIALVPKETTIGELTVEDVCTYIHLRRVTVTEVFDNNGTYSLPNVTVTDGTDSIQIYKAVVDKSDGENWDIQVGDVIGVKAALSTYGTKLQLRNTMPGEIYKELPASDYALVTELQEGCQVLLYNEANGIALSADGGAAKVKAVDGVITTELTDAAWTVGRNADGSYTFTQGEKVLGAAKENQLTYAAGEGYTGWSLKKSDTDGIFYLSNYELSRNSIEPLYLEVMGGYFTIYLNGMPNDEKNGISFYQLTESEEENPAEPTEPSEEPTEPTEPEQVLVSRMTGAPGDGDTVLIYNAANTAVLGAAADGKRMAGVTAAAEGDAIALTEEMAELLVSEEEGVYTFSLNGQYLTSGEGGNSLSFADSLTDCGKWTLEQQEDGTFILMNVGAHYNGNHNQALEYYKGFTTYGVKTTDIYRMDFYLVKEARKEGIVEELYDGDTVVIFNPAHLMALSSEYTGYYNKGTAVTLEDGKLSGYTAADIWTVGINEDGTYTFSTAEGKKLSLGVDYSSMPLDDVNTAWSIVMANLAMQKLKLFLHQHNKSGFWPEF